MYQNIFNSLIAFASLAIMAAADSVTVKDVTPYLLNRMSDLGLKFEMTKNETLSLQMNNGINVEPWRLASPVGAAYTVSQRW